MSAEFDPYYLWLGIPPAEQPPNHYRLLGLVMFESNRNVIEAAADRQMTFLRQYGTGPQGDASQKLLNEISQSLIDLLNPGKKADYDARLKKQIDQEVAAERSTVPVAIEPASVATRPTPVPATKAATAPPKPAPARKPRPVEKPADDGGDDYLDELVPRRSTPPRTGGRSKQRGGSGGIPQWAYGAGIGLILLVGAIVLWPKSAPARFGTVEVRVTDKEAAVALDGQPLERDRWSAPFTLAAGQHEATFTQGSSPPRTQRFWIVNGETTLVVLGAAAATPATIGPPPGRTVEPGPAKKIEAATGMPTGLNEVWRKKVDGTVVTTALNSDGSHAAVIIRDRLGTANGELQVWDRAKGERIQSRPVTSLAYDFAQFSPDGKLFYHLLRIENRSSAALWGWDWQTNNATLLVDLQNLAAESRPNTFASAAMTSDASRVAFALRDLTEGAGAKQTEISLWDVATKKEIAHVPSGLPGVTAMAFSPDGKVLATACSDVRGPTPARVELRDGATGSLLGTIPLIYPNDVISSLRFAGNSLCVGTLEKQMHCEAVVVDVERKQVVARQGQVDWRDSGGKLVAVAGSLCVMIPTSPIGASRMIDIVDGAPNLAIKARVPGPTNRCESLCASADGKLLLTGDAGGELVLWTIARGGATPPGGERVAAPPARPQDPPGPRLGPPLKERTRIEAGGMVHGIAVSPDGTRVAAIVAAGNQALQLYNSATGKLERSIPVNAFAQYAMRFSPDGKHIYFVNRVENDTALCVWETQSPQSEVRFRIGGPNNPERPHLVTDWDLSADATRAVFATKTFDNAPQRASAILVADLKAGTDISHRIQDVDSITTVAISPDGKTAMAAFLNAPQSKRTLEDSIRLWEVDTDKKIFSELFPGFSRINYARFSGDGRRLVLHGPRTGNFQTHDAVSGEKLFSKSVFPYKPQTVRTDFAIKVPRAVVGHEASPNVMELMLLDHEEGRVLGTGAGHEVGGYEAAISEDGLTGASGDRSGRIIVWELPPR